MKREWKIGEISDYGGRALVKVEVSLEKGRLSITGSIVGRRWGENWGQIDATLQKIPDHAWVWGPSFGMNGPAIDLNRLLNVWDQWHLNDMRAGCEHQRAWGWDRIPIDPTKPLDAYGFHFEGQAMGSRNMAAWIRPNEWRGGLLGAACPTCDYKYGTAWLVEELPEEVKQWADRWFQGRAS